MSSHVERTTSTTVHPDGSKTIETTDRTHNADGSITVETTTTTVPAPMTAPPPQQETPPPVPVPYVDQQTLPPPQQQQYQPPPLEKEEEHDISVPVPVPVPPPQQQQPPPPQPVETALTDIDGGGNKTNNVLNGGTTTGGEGSGGGSGGCSRRNKLIGLILLLLAVVGGVGAGVGIALSGGSDEKEEDPSSTSTGGGNGNGGDGSGNALCVDGDSGASLCFSFDECSDPGCSCTLSFEVNGVDAGTCQECTACASGQDSLASYDCTNVLGDGEGSTMECSSGGGSGSGSVGGGSGPSSPTSPTPRPSAPSYPTPNSTPNQSPASTPTKRPTKLPTSSPTLGSCDNFNGACEWTEVTDDEVDLSPDSSANSFAISDDFDFLVVGSPYVAVNGVINAGTVRTYVRSETDGDSRRSLQLLRGLLGSFSSSSEDEDAIQQQHFQARSLQTGGGDNFQQHPSLSLTGTSRVEQLGIIVDLSSDGLILAVFQGNNNDGKVLTYRRASVASNAWSPMTLVHSAKPEKFGLSADGTVLVIGYDDKTETYRRDDDDDNDSDGMADNDSDGSTNDGWTKFGQDIPVRVDEYSSGGPMAVSADGTVLAFGTSSSSDGRRVVSYRWSTSSEQWVELESLTETESGQYGIGGEVTLSANGNVLAVATTGWPFGLVRTYTFDASSDGWTYQGSIEYYEEGGGSLDMGNVALNYDGSVLAIGNPDNDNNYEGYGGCSGAVTTHHFDATSNRWEVFGDAIRGESGFYNIGKEVVLSSDGTRLAVGGNGAVRFYRLNL